MTGDVTVIIPAIPPRQSTYLPLAIGSVLNQIYPVAAISVAIDVDKQGAWHTRQRALDAARTDWVAFLDDDDEFYPSHLNVLMGCALDTDADFVFSYWDTSRTADILGHYGRVFDPASPHHTTTTVMVRTDIAQSVRFTPRSEGEVAGGEDWRFLLGCVAAGAKIVHVPQQTWYWRHHSGNTSGREDRW